MRRKLCCHTPARPEVTSMRGRMPDNYRSVLKVEYAPDKGSIHYVRLMVHSFVLLASGNRVLAGRLTVTSAELVENAVRSNPTRRCVLDLKMDLTGAAAMIELATQGSE